MGSSSLITLFSEPQQTTSLPSTFVLSILLHAGFCSLLTIKAIEDHRIIERFPTSRFAVRVLDFHSTEPITRQASAGSIPYPGSAAGSKGSGHKADSGASSASAAADEKAARQTAQLMPAPQTLIQPDLPPNLVMFKKVPVPLVVLWSPEKAAPKKRITPPLPDKPTIAVVRPTIDTPIKEEKLADLRISSSALVTMSPSIAPSTTSPIVVHGPEETQKVPETTSKRPDQQPATPARIISLSDVRVPDGTVVIPMANQSAAKMAPGATVPGQLKDAAKAADGSAEGKSKEAHASKTADSPAKPDSKSPSNSQSQNSAAVHSAGDSAGKGPKPGPGSGQALGQNAASPDKTLKAAGAGNATRNPAPSGAGNGPAQPTPAPPSASSSSQVASQATSPVPAQGGAAIGQSRGAAGGGGSGSQPGAVHISMPKDGQFGVVVVGSSIQEQYPETAELWSGRMAATVYLHVGLARSWIMQYALPRLEDAANVSGHLEAPWPYEIVRPNLDFADADSEALILHGYVTKEGRFEHLELLFPSDFPPAQMVLSVLNQWQFRPARQNSAATPVEVLLIIPSPSQ